MEVTETAKFLPYNISKYLCSRDSDDSHHVGNDQGGDDGGTDFDGGAVPFLSREVVGSSTVSILDALVTFVNWDNWCLSLFGFLLTFFSFFLWCFFSFLWCLFLWCFFLWCFFLWCLFLWCLFLCGFLGGLFDLFSGLLH